MSYSLFSNVLLFLCARYFINENVDFTEKLFHAWLKLFSSFFFNNYLLSIFFINSFVNHSYINIVIIIIITDSIVLQKRWSFQARNFSDEETWLMQKRSKVPVHFLIETIKFNSIITRKTWWKFEFSFCESIIGINRAKQRKLRLYENTEMLLRAGYFLFCCHGSTVISNSHFNHVATVNVANSFLWKLMYLMQIVKALWRKSS